MHALVVLAVLALAAASAQADVTANYLVDSLVSRFSGTKPFAKLPDLKDEADISVLFWDPTVSIEATDGAPVSDITLKRFGDAELTVDGNGYLALTAEIGFEQAECSYDYKTTIGKIKGPSGSFSASIGTTTVKTTIKLLLDEYICDLEVSSMSIGQLGEISLEKGGSTIANDVYRKLLLDMLQKNRSSVLQSFIDKELRSYGYDCDPLLPQAFKAVKAAKALAPSA